MAKKTAKKTYEIGATYQRQGIFFVAINEKTLLTFNDGSPKFFYFNNVQRVLEVSFEQILKGWGVTSKEIDKYLYKEQFFLETERKRIEEEEKNSQFQAQ